jgi:hypothetical protein
LLNLYGNEPMAPQRQKGGQSEKKDTAALHDVSSLKG